MLPGCRSACLPSDPGASMFLALLWPVKPLCTGPGLVCEDRDRTNPAKLGADTIKQLKQYIVFEIIVYNSKNNSVQFIQMV
jgi:hypothetical protein